MFRQGWRESFRYAGFVRTKPEARIVQGCTILARIRVRLKTEPRVPFSTRVCLRQTRLLIAFPTSMSVLIKGFIWGREIAGCGTDGSRARKRICTRVETCDTNGIARFHDEFCFAKHRSAVSAGEASRQPFCGTDTACSLRTGFSRSIGTDCPST